jgi:hypothetical protein
VNGGPAQEALRQQMLLRALWRDARPGVVEGWLRDAPARRRRGLQAYQANAGALAERALAAAFPTIAQLIGAESFASLARALWHRHAPQRGDIADWGGELADFIAQDKQLDDEPYLADVARLDWAWHRAASEADDGAPPAGLDRLAEADPAALWLRLRHGTALLRSTHPVVTIWRAHQSAADDRFEPVRAAFEAGHGETALVCRIGLKPEVFMLDERDASFVEALLKGRSLDDALSAADGGFDFEAWLIAALQSGWLTEVCRQPWKGIP